MEYLVGTVLALAGLGAVTVAGIGRERGFYPTILIWIASYYLLFAVMSGQPETLLVESVIVGLFLLLALVGYKGSLWLVVAGLAAHGIFDFVHKLLIQNPGVPAWWPGFCLVFDLVTAGFLGFVLLKRPIGFERLTRLPGN